MAQTANIIALHAGMGKDKQCVLSYLYVSLLIFLLIIPEEYIA